MKSNVKITSMSKLRKEKARLALQIDQQKTEILGEVEKFKESLWPFKVLRRVRKTVESISENKLLVIGAQLAYSFLNSRKGKKSSEEKEESKNAEGKNESGPAEEKKENNVLNFLKDVAKNFLEMYIPKQEEEKKD